MKANCIIHYVLAILEGALSGACFYRANREETTKRKALLLFCSAGWFALSLCDSFLGGRALRELKEEGGADND